MTTYCDEEKQKECDHWNAEISECEYKRPNGSCFIGGIENLYIKDEEEKE